MDDEKGRIERFLRNSDDPDFWENLGTRGTFKPTTRKRLLGIVKGSMGRAETNADFWHNVRTSVKNTLYDLALFVGVASNKDVNMVITEETLSPFLEALLWAPVVDKLEGAKPDPKRAEIANLMVRLGFNYLSKMKPDNVRPNDRKLIDEALELSAWLTGRYSPSPR